jgi:hypothetical protein
VDDKGRKLANDEHVARKRNGPAKEEAGPRYWRLWRTLKRHQGLMAITDNCHLTTSGIIPASAGDMPKP